ncbi:MAG: SRPBCC family protein [Microthrixaceae bacterium]
MTRLACASVIAAPPSVIWDALADFGNISRWVPLVQHSCLLSDQQGGAGAVRRVQIARQTLVERVTRWDAPESLAYTIEGLPPIVGTATNTWILTPAGEVTEVTVTTAIETGFNPAKKLIASKVLERMSLASDAMLAGLNAEVARRGEAPGEALSNSEATR